MQRSTKLAILAAAVLAIGPLGAVALGLGAEEAAPPPVTVRLEVEEVEKEIMGVPYHAWTFNGVVPGPIIRIPQHTQLTIDLVNGHTEVHSFHTHIQNYDITNDGSSHTVPLSIAPHQADDPLGAVGLTSGHDIHVSTSVNPIGTYIPREDHDVVPPGGERLYTFQADEVGTFVYHCHVFPVESHINHGLYGLIIVYPPGWTWDDSGLITPQESNTDAWVTAADGTVYYEDVVMIGELDLTGASETASVPTTQTTGKLFVTNFHTWARPYYLGPVPDGTLMRVVVGNMGQTINSWHIHGHNFNVLDKFDPQKRVKERTDVLLVGPGQSFETTLVASHPGFWMVHDHTTTNQYAGLMPWLQIT
ncbi:MAG TPA: multicopper oxidase domain-containing protein [Candidatus Thermoplasmatota archaeon]|jgi:FtsP/CotA-like multicopper oxidase with cupredoxin domain|nr:multicopper oxidase domain-containing protein [Candidatus Thermoplasmatota archaeon]